MPPARALSALGLSTMASLPTSGDSTAGSANPLMALVGGSTPLASKPPERVIVAPGAPALKRSMVQLMLFGAYVDFGELPPAKGFSKPLPALTQGMDGQIVLLQATDLAQSKKLIPDVATWVQCFSLYAAVLIAKSPERAPSLLSYMATICKFSKP